MDKRYYIGDAVYGANDGIITTFAIVSGVIGANLEFGVVLIIGFASLIADGFSMAASSYLSDKSQRSVINEIEGSRAHSHTNAVAGSITTFFHLL